MRSDNGKNFIGASNELKQCIKNLNQTTINNYLTTKNIEWKFNPPVSPWMGGIWESLVKSVKRALKVIIRDKLFTDESLITFVCEVESILNQRPLTTISDDITDFDALTPYHYLIGTNCQNTNPGVFHKEEIDLFRKWRSVQAATNIFWNRWRREYLPSLNIRKRWTKTQQNFRIGDLVIVSDKDAPRSRWPLGRVTEVYPGRDGVIRTVKVSTSKNEFIRPSGILCLLEATE